MMICQFIDWPLAGLPLLDNDSEDSDEIDMKTAATKSSRHRLRSTNSNSDDNYLKETRTWTSVRDKHLQFKSEGPKTSDIFRETSGGTKNNASDRGIKEEQIINLSLSDDWIFIMFYTYLVLTYFSYQENAWNASQWFVHFFYFCCCWKRKEKYKYKMRFSNYIQGQRKTYSETEDS